MKILLSTTDGAYFVSSIDDSHISSLRQVVFRSRHFQFYKMRYSSNEEWHCLYREADVPVMLTEEEVEERNAWL